jgi:cholesterol transport system auxiliary component
MVTSCGSLRALALPLMAVLSLGGCSALASLDASSQTLTSYELTVPPSQARGGSGPLLSVERPAATGAVDSERIAIRPGALTIAYLPDGQWIDPAPDLVRNLLVQALAGTGRFALVTGEMGGPLPELALYGDLDAFEAVVGTTEAGDRSVQVVVRLRLVLVRDFDRSLVATRVFEQRAGAASDGTAQIVAAFDAAMDALLREAAAWTASAARGTS